MEFLIVGGGCYGSFYSRQLLRGSSTIDLTKLHIVDHDPDCRVFKEYRDRKDSRIVLYQEDWKIFLHRFFSDLLVRYEKGEEISHQYAPPCLAPHILSELFFEKLMAEKPQVRINVISFKESVGTPLDMVLPSENRALSFATWMCPHSCIEPPTCPHTRGPKHWDMKDYLLDYFQSNGAPKIDKLIVFQCLHYAMGVGTIPLKSVIEEYIELRNLVSEKGRYVVAAATVSSCHGLIGLMEVQYE